MGVAGGDIVAMDSIDKAMMRLRANISRAVMGISMTTGLLQPFGILQSVVRVGWGPVLRGLGRWAGDAAQLESSMTWIREKSPFMKLRAQMGDTPEVVTLTAHYHNLIRQWAEL